MVKAGDGGEGHKWKKQLLIYIFFILGACIGPALAGPIFSP